MKPYEINALIAEKVLGFEVRDGNIVRDQKRSGIPSYSTKIEWAWKVVEKLRETKIFSLYDAWDENDNPIFGANFQYNDMYHVINYEAYAETAPLAICKAALKTAGVEV